MTVPFVDDAVGRSCGVILVGTRAAEASIINPVMIFEVIQVIRVVVAALRRIGI